MSLISAGKRFLRTRGLERLGVAYTLEAPMDDAPDPLRVLSINLPLEFLQDVWEGPLKQVRKRPCLVGDLSRLTDRGSSGFDVCLAWVPESQARRMPAGPRVLRGRVKIRQGVDIPGDWEALRRTFHATKRRVAGTYARGTPPSHEISHDERDLRFFYHQMYVPHMTQRFGRFATLDSYEHIAEAFRRGFLLKVPAGGEPIASALCEVRGDTFIYRRIGVRETPVDPVWGGSTSAVYYLMLRQAWERRLARLDMMRARAFLRDGVYLYKRQWGAQVAPDDGGTKGWMVCVATGEPGRVAHFFERCPLIVQGRAGLVAAVGVTSGGGLDAVALERKYHAPGLAGALVFGPEAEAPVELPFTGHRPAAGSAPADARA